MDASIKAARAAVHKYLAAPMDDGQDFMAFTRAYCTASEACIAAGVTLAQLRTQLMKGGAK
jgi:hypothetical protein